MSDHVLEEIKAERDRAEAKFPDQHLPSGTDNGFTSQTIRDNFRQDCDVAHRDGYVTWKHVLREEVYEAFAESDPTKLRAELLQVAAMSVRWIEDLDRALLSPPVGTQPDDLKMEEAMDDFAQHTTPGGTWIFEDESGEPRE